jgi:hypothetical protein
MATVDKNFRIKHGLVVQGSSATVNGNQVLTEASTLADLSGIDLSGLADGKVLIYNSSTSTWTIGDSGSSIAISETAPSSPSAGDTWFDSSTGKTYIYYVDANSSQWIEMSNLGDNNLISKLADVDLSSLSDGHVLVYNSTSEKWISANLNTDAVLEGSSNLYFTEARALSAVQSSYEAYADQAESDAIATAAADATNKASTAESNANAYTASVAATIAPGDASTLTSAQAYTDSEINALDTDDIEEGSTNLYFTDARAVAAVTESVTLDNLSDVDTTGVSNGDALVYDQLTSKWIPGEGGGGASIFISDTAPQFPEEGNLWLDSVTGNTYIYYSDADTDQWVQTAGPNIVPNRGANLTVSSTAPPAPVSGDLWYDPSEGYTYLYYVDEDSSQWVQFGLNRNGADGTIGSDGSDGVGVPVGGNTGQALVKSSNTDYATEWADFSSSLSGLTDISISSPTESQALLYNSSTSNWENSDINLTDPIKLNGNTISSNYSIPTGYNGLSAGPVTIADGITVTIADGSSWSIV